MLSFDLTYSLEAVASCPMIFMGLALVHFQKYWLLIARPYCTPNSPTIISEVVFRSMMEIPLVHPNLALIQEVYRYQVSSLLRMKFLSTSTQNLSLNFKVKLLKGSTSNTLHLVSFCYETLVLVPFWNDLKYENAYSIALQFLVTASLLSKV